MSETAQFVRAAGGKGAISGLGTSRRVIGANGHARIGDGLILGDYRPTKGVLTHDVKVSAPNRGAKSTSPQVNRMGGKAGDRQRPIVCERMLKAHCEVRHAWISEVRVDVGGPRTTFRRVAKTIHRDGQSIREQIRDAVIPGAGCRLAAWAAKAEQIGGLSAAAGREKDARRLRVVEPPRSANDGWTGQRSDAPSYTNARTPLIKVLRKPLWTG